ncbi:HEAT repeat domain-containing protein [Nostoc spongiaeforme FACHB-130]|uniref:HEAT repeat domain-containing protein n=1 Tax=Nostoc spongiaeforme FACHB-130 TaxID=1357510 RepID=A0ABR8G3T7_9NOSO|nr:HEAT repeat domain-containing protein [Nostoc spongiaeforme]MBD2597930.1 HEAT repeat domain-containing protein [Nostoc spongiaeforme FACHB-130]
MSDTSNQFFIQLENWKYQEFNPQIGITEPKNYAYAIQFQTENRNRSLNLEHFNRLLQDTQISQLQALICHIRYSYSNENTSFGIVLEAICDACEQLPNLQALFIGDTEQHEYRKSKLAVFDIRPILEAFPNLQLLKVRGQFYQYLLECESCKHENLKTLIIETADINSDNFAQICALELPNLEYLELWFGRQLPHSTFVMDVLAPILSGTKFPNLAYLGLRSSEFSDLLAEEIVQSPIIERLLVLDLSMGNLSSAQALLNCPAINQLHTLNISNNCLSEGMVQRLLQLNCQVIADEQEIEVDRGCGASRYSALHE